MNKKYIIVFLDKTIKVVVVICYIISGLSIVVPLTYWGFYPKLTSMEILIQFWLLYISGFIALIVGLNLDENVDLEKS